jgi:hypothetical protein
MIFGSGFFHKSSSPRPWEIRKFVDLQNLIPLQSFYMCGNLWICTFRTQYFLQFSNLRFADQNGCGLKTSANLQILYFSAYKYIPKMF